MAAGEMDYLQGQEMDYLQDQLQERKRRLETAIALTPQDANLPALLREVDSALDRFAAGTYGLCENCHDTVERERLLADPLIRFCLDHLNALERDALQRDLDLASDLQRNLLPPENLKAASWETSYHYAPVGPVSGDYCDLYPFDGQLFFALGDVSGKGVAASMRMTQLHALFRSLVAMGLSLAEIIAHVNRFLSDSALAGQYVTLVCGLAKAGGDVELFNAGHLPVVVRCQGSVRLLESTGLPLGMFREAAFTSASLHFGIDDVLFLYTDGLSEARRENDEYGIERVMQLVGRQPWSTAAELVSASLDDLRGFAGATPGMDDVALLAIRHSG
jgi:sigma-B regulation protein RsbU (phosphoserine phosphatase)